MKKKIVAIFIATILSVSLVACGGNSTADTKQETKTSVAATDKKDDKKDDTGKEDSKKKETEKAEAEKESEDKKSETADKTDATETADKKDSKETSNKAEKSNDNKVADKSDKDKNSANNSSVSKPSNSGNANNNGSASKPSTPAKPNKPSGNNSGSSNNGNHNGSVNKPSKPAEKPVEKPNKPVETPSEPSKPAPHVHNYNTVVSSTNGDCSHVGKVTKECSCGATVTENGSYGDHKWENQYKEVHHDAKYEERPVYKWVGYHECRKCGFQTEDDGTIVDHCLDCDSTYTTKEKQVQTGTESVQVEKPWTEQVPDGKKCTICGTHQ